MAAEAMVRGSDSPSQEVALAPGWREDRAWILAVLVKRTYDLRDGAFLVRSESAAPIQRNDRYWGEGDPERNSVRLETELVPYKPRTDVVVLANARAPHGRPVQILDVAVEFGGRRKSLRVTGDRRCVHRPFLPPLFTEPEPFTEMPVRYERAYGGLDLRSEPKAPFYYPRNPTGRGLALGNGPEQVEGLALPNVEDPEDLLTPERVVLGERTRWNEAPLPQGFGWYQRNWYPRCSFAGSVPAFAPLNRPMREEVLGLVPEDQVALARAFRLPSFDVRLGNGASFGLVFDAVRGDETMRLENLTAEGVSSFALPGERPRMALDVGEGPVELESRLHTVLVRTEDAQLDLLWRGAYDISGIGALSEMPRIVAEVA